MPVEVPAAKVTEDAPAVQVTVPKSANSVKVGIPVEKVTPGTVAILVKADGTEGIVKTLVLTENGVVLKLDVNGTRAQLAAILMRYCENRKRQT